MNMLKALILWAHNYGSNTKHSRHSSLGGQKRSVRSTTDPIGKEQPGGGVGMGPLSGPREQHDREATGKKSSSRRKSH